MAEPSLGIPFCGLTQRELAQAQAGQVCRWLHNPVTMSHNMDLRASNISTDQINQVFERVAAQWTAACGIDLRFIGPGERSNIFAESGLLDGRNGVLGQSYLPCGAVTPSTVIGQTFDNGEAWTVDFLFRVVLHEVGHAVGIDHAPQGSAVMSPYLTDFSTLQAWDINQGQSRYGPPLAVTPPVTPPGIPPITPPVNPDVPGTINIFSKKVVQVPFAGIINVPKTGRWLLRVDSGPRAKTVTLSMVDRPG